MKPDSVRAELVQSLRRLGLERIDLYQVHWPPEDGTPLEQYWATMTELRSEGLVRAIGLSNHDAPQLRRAEAIGHVDTLQPPFSMIRREAADAIAAAAGQETGVIAYSPMQSGLLSGHMTRERVAAMPADDWRHDNEDFTGESLTRNLALAETLRPLADRLDVSVAAVAVAWTLCWPGVTGAIVGARNADQVRDWLPAAGLTLDAEDLLGISASIRETHAGEGPVEPAASVR
jgi:aryl-alcohol dehydrogenase-like predicted oxidoreductase